MQLKFSFFEFLICSRNFSEHSGQMPCEIGIPDFAEISSSAARHTGEVHQAHAVIRVKESEAGFIDNLSRLTRLLAPCS
jgi:hypothetical protein